MTKRLALSRRKSNRCKTERRALKRAIVDAVKEAIRNNRDELVAFMRRAIVSACFALGIAAAAAAQVIPMVPTDPVSIDVIAWGQVSYTAGAKVERVVGGRVAVESPLSEPKAGWVGWVHADLTSTPGQGFDPTNLDTFGRAAVLTAGAAKRLGDRDVQLAGGTLRKALFAEGSFATSLEDKPLDRYQRSWRVGVRLTHGVGGAGEGMFMAGWGRCGACSPDFRFGQWWFAGHVHVKGTGGVMTLGGEFALNVGPGSPDGVRRRDYGILWVGVNLPPLIKNPNPVPKGQALK